MATPLVTIFTPIYNTGIYVIRALECIQRQTYRNFEHIIIDDCSSDNSCAMVEEWVARNNHACTFIKNEANKGIPKTINMGKKMAKGKYICSLGDDEWSDDYLEKRINHFEQLGEDVGITFSDMAVIDVHSAVIAPSYYEYRKVDVPEILKNIGFLGLLNRKFIINAPSAVHRRAIYDVVGYHDEQLTIEDFDMFLRIARKFSFVFYDKPLVYYRIRPNSLSAVAKGGKLYIDKLNVYNKYLAELAQLDKKERLEYRKMAIVNYDLNKDTRAKFFLISFKLNKDLKSLCYIFICLFKIKPAGLEKIRRLIFLKF